MALMASIWSKNGPCQSPGLAVVAGLVHLGGTELGGCLVGFRAGQHGALGGIVENPVALLDRASVGVGGIELGGRPVGIHA